MGYRFIVNSKILLLIIRVVETELKAKLLTEFYETQLLWLHRVALGVGLKAGAFPPPV